MIDELIVHYSHSKLQDIDEDAEIVEMVDAVTAKELEVKKQIEKHDNA